MEEHADAYLPRLGAGGVIKLSTSIRKLGQLYPILTSGGKIIDGRSRYLACKLAGITPIYQDVSHLDPADVHLECNLKRKNNRYSDMSECEDVKWWSCFEGEADERPVMMELIKAYAGETGSPRLAEIILQLMSELATRTD
jgi:hypothetical protein